MDPKQAGREQTTGRSSYLGTTANSERGKDAGRLAGAHPAALAASLVMCVDVWGVNI